MSPLFRRAALMMCIFALLVIGSGVSAQTSAPLALAQPALATLTDPAVPVTFTYTLAQPSTVTMQALSETVAPTITIRTGAGVLAQAANAELSFTATLSAFLDAGVYTVEVGTGNAVVGTVLMVVQSETPVAVQTLLPGAQSEARVNTAAPVAAFSFAALAEPAYLFIESGLADGGPAVRLVNVLTNSEVAALSPELSGGRLRIPAGVTAYQLSITYSGRVADEPFSVCLVPVSVGGCGSVPAPVVTVEVASATCTVTPQQAGGANIRQSASTSAAILAALPGGQIATVIGVSPDNAFFNVTFNAINGWIARSAVNVNGDCSVIPVVQPPPIQAAPTAAPAQPTGAPAQPTQVPPTVVPTPTMSGPCLITVTAPTYIYQSPLADISNLQDQVQAGGQLIPTGRLADNSWWRLNYAGAWIETSLFGVSVQVTGDCSTLPIITA